MTIARSAIIALVLLASGGSTGQTPPQSQQPVFRSQLDVVTVDVSVRTGGTPVGGLRAEDFVLLDNGVPQTIDSIEIEAVPVDVTVLVDANEDLTFGVGGFHDVVQEIASRLRPIDRLRVTAVNQKIADVVRARPVASLSPLERFTPAGLSSVNDGIASALLRAVDANRRYLVIALTNGLDAVSTLDAAAVLEMARRSHATLHIALVDMALEGEPPNVVLRSGRQKLEMHRCGAARLCQPTRVFWRPYDDRAEWELLREAAKATGGDMHLPGLFIGASSIFAGVFRDYRRSYLLRYTPKGVTRERWHEITVTVPKYPSYTIHARRGYMVEGAPAQLRSAAVSSTVTSNPAAARPPSAIDEIVAAYDRADYTRVTNSFRSTPNLATLIGEFQKAGNPWPANARREAAFVIEMAEAALHAQRLATKQSGARLLHDYQKLVRHPLWPDQFERYWRWVGLAILQGASEPETARQFVEEALERFPDEPRFVLARAIVNDQLRPFDASDGRTGAARSSHVKEVLAAYDAAIGFQDTAAEARIRKAWFLHRIGRHQEALESLNAAGGTVLEQDPIMRYLRELIRGRVLETLGEETAAAAAYRAAQELKPNAQSPRVALMRLAVRRGEQANAQALADEIQQAPDDAFDPWWLYWLGDYRLYPGIIDRLREQTR